MVWVISCLTGVAGGADRRRGLVSRPAASPRGVPSAVRLSIMEPATTCVELPHVLESWSGAAHRCPSELRPSTQGWLAPALIV
jgi:hypothetical protein